MGQIVGRAFLIITLFLCACGPPQAPVRIGVLIWPPYELAYLAQQQGRYPTGDLELVSFQTPAEVVRAYRYGLIDGMFLTTQFALDQRDLPPGVRLVYVIDKSHGGDSLLAQSDITRLNQLKGKTVGVEASPLGAYMLRRALDHAGLEREDINLTFIDTPAHFYAFQEQRVDAIITYEPTRHKLLEQGANELFASRDIPGEIIDVLFVSDDALEMRRKPLGAFVAALADVAESYPALSDEQLKPLAQRESLTVEEYRRVMSGTKLMNLDDNRRLMDGGPTSPLARQIEQQVANLARATPLEKPVNPAQLIDSTLIQ